MASLVAGTDKGIWFLNGGRLVELEERQAGALVAAPDGLWAILDGQEVRCRSADGRWQDGARVEGLRLNCLLRHGASLFVGASDARLLRVSGRAAAPLAGFDAAEDRDAWYTPWGGPPDVRTISAGEDDRIYANVHVGGILRSEDGGGSWRQTIDIDADVHEVRTAPGHPGLVVAAAARGMHLSADGGETWSLHHDGLHARYCRAIAIAGDTLLLSASLGPRGGRAALYRRPLAGDGPFVKCETGLPEWLPDNIDSGCVAASDSLVAFGTGDGRVFVSEDEGRTWAQAAEGLAPVRALALI